MLYPNLKFPKIPGRPFFYTDFVQTVDGKTEVLKNTGQYWPIGSKTDSGVVGELRAYSDCLIHGGRLGYLHGDLTYQNLNKPIFYTLRKKVGKPKLLPYYIVTHHPASYKNHLKAPVNLYKGSLMKLAGDLGKWGYQNILVEGGSTLLGSFLKENLLDEIFLTIAPKIFGNQPGQTLTLVENILFKPNKVKRLKLLSVKQIEDELFLRYSVRS